MARVNNSFPGFEQVTGLSHTTVVSWLLQVGNLLSDTYDSGRVPEIGELNEVQTFVGKKKSIDLDSRQPL